MTRAGLSYVDWCRMTQWQRRDHLARHELTVGKRLKNLENAELSTVIGAVVSKLMGA